MIQGFQTQYTLLKTFNEDGNEYCLIGTNFDITPKEVPYTFNSKQSKYDNDKWLWNLIKKYKLAALVRVEDIVEAEPEAIIQNVPIFINEHYNIRSKIKSEFNGKFILKYYDDHFNDNVFIFENILTDQKALSRLAKQLSVPKNVKIILSTFNEDVEFFKVSEQTIQEIKKYE